MYRCTHLIAHAVTLINSNLSWQGTWRQSYSRGTEWCLHIQNILHSSSGGTWNVGAKRVISPLFMSQLPRQPCMNHQTTRWNSRAAFYLNSFTWMRSIWEPLLYKPFSCLLLNPHLPESSLSSSAGSGLHLLLPWEVSEIMVCLLFSLYWPNVFLFPNPVPLGYFCFATNITFLFLFGLPGSTSDVL